MTFTGCGAVGSAPGLGPGGPGFKSPLPDHLVNINQYGYAFTTEPNAFKVRRIRNDARASIAAWRHVLREANSWQGRHSRRRCHQSDIE